MQLVNKSIVAERASYFTIAMLWLEITRLSPWGYRRAAQVRVRWLVAVHTRDYRRWATRLQSSGSNLTFESRLGFPSDLPNMVVGLQAAINRFVGEANVDPKPFAWLADPNKSIFAVRRGYQVLDSIH
jgi:hypothetical protein